VSGTHFIFDGEQFWGRAAGRSGLERVRGALNVLRDFSAETFFAAEACLVNSNCDWSDFSLRHSIGGDRKVDRDFRLGLDGVGAFVVRLEVPLLDGFLGGIRQDGRTAQHVEILD